MTHGLDDWFGGVPQPEVDWYPEWLPAEPARTLLARIADEVAWRQDSMRTPRGLVPLPRLTAWQGEPEAVYLYSGIRNVPAPWTPAVRELHEAVQAACGARFNSVLLNRYRDGRDSMGWHSDDEAELGPAPVIASVSLGAPRRFELRHLATGVVQTYRVTPGSMLVMRGRTQAEWVHRVPKAPALDSERINLTFRWIEPARS